MSSHAEIGPVVFILLGAGATRQSLESLVRAAGWRVEVFESAQGFLRSPRPCAPSCLVLGAALADMCGLELQERLAGTRPDLAIVFVATGGDVATGVRAMKAGAVDFLTVPCDESAILGAVEQAIVRSGAAIARDAQQRTPRAGDAPLNGRQRGSASEESQLPPLQVVPVLHVVKPSGALRRCKRAGSPVDRRADTVANLQMLTASIAHEVKQPLSGILTNAGTCLRMLSGDLPNIDGARETARRTIRDVDRATEVINRLRALFTTGAHAAEALDLNETVLEALADSQSDLECAQITVRCHLDHEMAPLRGDRVQIQQVISNLVRNAIESMSDVHSRPRELTIASRQDDCARVMLSVEDTGEGIAPEDTGRLFEPFYTTKPGGMGIGLCVSRSIVERHGGRLWATANKGPGATFWLSIPGAGRVTRGRRTDRPATVALRVGA